MVWISPDDEKRLDSVQWLHGAFMRGIQLDVERKDVALYAVTDDALVELLCEDALYASVPNLLDWKEPPRLVGLVVQPLDKTYVVRIEFANHPAQVHVECGRFTVRRDPLKGYA